MLKATLHGPVRCQFPGGCTETACDADERLPRGRGGSITDPGNLLLLCRAHHDWKHAHPHAAAEMGIFDSAKPGLARPSTLSDTSVSVIPVSDAPNHSPRLSIRISPAGLALADQLAAEAGMRRSDAVRALFAVGSRHRADVLAYMRSRRPADD
jgi:hypothetical protein